MAKAFTTNTTELTLDIIGAYKEKRMSKSEAQAFANDLLEQAIEAIEENPLQYREDIDALERGVRLRRWLNPTGEYICLYRYNEATDEAILDIFASTRQDWQSLLYLVQISHP